MYVVATPIGNLADLGLRALHVLALADAVACEDTRVTGELLRHLGLDKPRIAVHRHNEHTAAAKVLQRLRDGQRVAYASDAGTPAIADPGAGLVAEVAAAGFRVLPVPGPSSLTAALSVAGDAQAQGFACVGFLPARGGARAAALAALLVAPGAQVLFEAPHRIEALAAELAQAAPRRRLTLCRELSKQFETVITLPAGELPPWLAADPNRRRGRSPGPGRRRRAARGGSPRAGAAAGRAAHRPGGAAGRGDQRRAAQRALRGGAAARTGRRLKTTRPAARHPAADTAGARLLEWLGHLPPECAR